MLDDPASVDYGRRGGGRLGYRRGWRDRNERDSSEGWSTREGRGRHAGWGFGPASSSVTFGLAMALVGSLRQLSRRGGCLEVARTSVRWRRRHWRGGGAKVEGGCESGSDRSLQGWS